MFNLFFPSHWIFSVFNFPPSPASLTLLSTCLTPICPTKRYFTWHCRPCWACYLQLILPKTGFTSNLSHFNASTQLTTPINPSILQSSVYHQILFKATVGCIQVFFCPNLSHPGFLGSLIWFFYSCITVLSFLCLFPAISWKCRTDVKRTWEAWALVSLDMFLFPDMKKCLGNTRTVTYKFSRSMKGR